ncbi:PhzF family phenazine biosynthesis protein [uncultured Aquitalea sp.]|uniref:PhzF family phenazine biosynthesis protein n=1 Tax=uncultured Aquitalea sp. TaxID=540272 RepID=UPI0025F891F8|nr:PhzF family phenazine biosynthesis protein [uncultured Aquitalea sp.]
MSRYAYQLVNVFAESPFGGNPLCVFTDAHGLDDRAMQLLARQMNLSETVFIFPSERATASLRIFTPSYELPFAGHPTIGSASVLHALRGLGDDFALETRAGVIPIRHAQGCFTLQANAASERESGVTVADTAAMLGLAEDDILASPTWVNTGTEQMLVRVASKAAVLRARPLPTLFLRSATLRPGRSIAYLWHEDRGIATVRLFFEQLGAVIEDPGTGSACANLGGWCSLHLPPPLQWRVEQGEAIQRPNVLYLGVDEALRITVGGKVMALGGGVLDLSAFL